VNPFGTEHLFWVDAGHADRGVTIFSARADSANASPRGRGLPVRRIPLRRSSEITAFPGEP